MADSRAVLVGIIMGSDSDLPVMQPAATILKQLQIPCELTIVSAHRTPDRMFTYARGAEQRGLKTIIAGAGGAAHLPGMVAALTLLPVIGVPVAATALQGQDALLSMVQMPKGVPVATVAIDNAMNAGLLAAQIIGIEDSAVRDRLRTLRQAQTRAVQQKVDALARDGQIMGLPQ